MLTIDGSTLEGGGQLTRLALSLSAITGTPIRIHSIRAGRAAKRRRGGRHHHHGPVPTGSTDRARNQEKGKGKGKNKEQDKTTTPAGGLHHSHLAALEFLAEQCNARVQGAFVGSTEVVFRPGKVNPLFNGNTRNREFTIALETSGSVWLIFQAVFPFIVFGMEWPAATNGDDGDDYTVTLTLRGGTNVSSAMCTEYMTEIFLPLAAQINLPLIEIETVRRGWAGPAPEVGEVKVTIHRPRSVCLPGFTLPTASPSPAQTITQISMILLCPPSSTPHLTSTLTSQLATAFPTVPLDSRTTDSLNPRRISIHLTAHTAPGIPVGFTYLHPGKLGRNPTETSLLLTQAVTAAVSGLIQQVARLGEGACIDQYLEDQLVVFQALARGESRVRWGRGERVDRDEDGDFVELGEEGSGKGDQSGTMHARTARWVCERILGDVGVRFGSGAGEGEGDGAGVVNGVAWEVGRRGEDLVGVMAALEVSDQDDEEGEDEDGD